MRRLLGSLTAPEKRFYDLYDLANEVVYISYSSGTCNSGWNVPSDTVVSISVTPKTDLRVTDLRLDQASYKKKADSHVLGIIYYIDEDDGITLQTADEKVTKIYYYPAKKDDPLRCPDNPRPMSVEDGESKKTFDKIDTYGDIPFEREKERLDQLALQLQNMPDMRGYIIAYAGRGARINEAKVRADRARMYLIKEQGIGADRIITMDGGYRERLTVDIYLVPLGARAIPIPTPTVAPNEVELIRGRSVKRNRRRPRRN